MTCGELMLKFQQGFIFSKIFIKNVLFISSLLQCYNKHKYNQG